MLKYFKTIFKPFRWARFPKIIFVVGLFTGCLMFPLMQVFSGLMQKFLVNAVEYQRMDYMNYVYILAAAILFMAAVLNPLGCYMSNIAMQIYKKNLRELTMEKLLSYPCSFYEAYQTGDLITRLRDDLDALPASFDRLLLGLFYGGGSVIVMLTFNWQLSLYVIFLCLAESFVMAKISKKITENTEILQKIKGVQNQLLFDIIKSISFIKMASISRIIRERYEKNNHDYAKKNMEINRVNIVLNAVNDIFEAVNILSVFGLGIALYLANRLDLGSVMAFLFLQDGVSYMIYNLKEFLSGTRAQIVNCERIEELLNQKAEENNIEKTKLQNADIQVKNLRYKYGASPNYALDGVSFMLPKGKITVIYGESGGGKSTLVKMLLALCPIQEGNIQIGEMDYSHINKSDIRDFFAYVEQSTYLFYDTIEANIRTNNETATIDEVKKAAKLSRAHDFIIQKPNGYQTQVEEYGGNFSGGEKQRIAIARAILKDASVFLFDEATNAVDVENESHIYDYMRELSKLGKTILIIAHRENARLLADGEIRLEQGKILT